MNTIGILSRHCTHGVLCITLGLLAYAGAKAQTWEEVYGGNSCTEAAHNNVAPVTGTCATLNSKVYNGYITVGESKSRGNSTCVDNDVYIVRFDNSGTPLWENTYDIGGAGNDDIGYSIKELANGSGFIVTGSTHVGPGNYDIFLMKLDCQGSVLWVNTYGGTGSEEAFDIIETTSGTPALGTNVGDFVVAGTTTSTGTTQDAYLLRTTSAGVLIWDASYDFGTGEGGGADWFNSLIEATPNALAGQTSGDIVAVGASLALGGTTAPKAIAARVDGNTGAINALPPSLQNFAWYIGTEFFEARELTVGTQAGNLVFAGFWNVPLIAAEVYTVVCGGDPCSTPIVQGYINTTNLNDQAKAYGIREVTNVTGVTAGTLALTGRFDPGSGSGGDADMFLLTLNPATLAVTSSQLYGLIGAGNYEWGNSLYEVPSGNGRTAGFIIAGLTQSNPEGASPADPQDMYVVKTNAGDSTQCSRPWGPEKNYVYTLPTCVTPTISSIGLSNPSSASAWASHWPDRVCTFTTSKSSRGATGSGESVTTGTDSPAPSLLLHPNPVKRGSTLSLEFTPTGTAELRITIIDNAGKIVARSTAANTGRALTIPVSTEGLPVGSYAINVSDGMKTNIVQVVVID